MADIVTQESQFGAEPNEASDALSATKRTAVLILGMHRSGTSAATRAASLLGADLPSKLMEAEPDNNICGFWKSLEVHELNEAILASAASSWDDWRRFNPDWIRSSALRPSIARALEILEDNFAKSPLFVLKDPRMCRLLPFWLEALRKFGAHVKCIIPLRNPMEVAASLKRRDGFSPAKSHMLWLRHVLEAESFTRDMPRAFLAYEEPLDDWRGTVARLAGELDLAWPRYSATAEVEIDRFLGKRHRHHNIEPEVLLHHPRSPGGSRIPTPRFENY